MEKFTVKNGKKLKYGFTTGSCAAAAAAAAAAMLFSGEKVSEAEVILPAGEKTTMQVSEIDIDKGTVCCTVIKDGGDDPDATHGAGISACVSKEPISSGTLAETRDRITLLGGCGIGIITAKGLQCSVGEPAINPVPRQMIFENVQRIRRKYGKEEEPIYIEISVPCGAEIAKKTYNPRLGIVGGISILGTTGIVDPMSEKALVDTIKTVIDKQYQENPKRILIAPGNYGREFCREYLGLDIAKAVSISNYIGEALDYIKFKGFEEILLVGHTGKLIKLAAGIMNTHSSYADGRMEIIGMHSAVCGADCDTVKAIAECITTDEAFALIQEKNYYEEVKARILEKVLYHLHFRLKGQVKVETVLFTTDRNHIMKSPGADQLAEMIRKDMKQI